jgi:hypothetical protein
MMFSMVIRGYLFHPHAVLHHRRIGREEVTEVRFSFRTLELVDRQGNGWMIGLANQNHGRTNHQCFRQGRLVVYLFCTGTGRSYNRSVSRLQSIIVFFRQTSIRCGGVGRIGSIIDASSAAVR